MGLFGRVEQEEFVAFKNEMTATIRALRQEINESATDSEEVAKKAAENAEAAQQRVRVTEGNVELVLRELSNYRDEAKKEVQILREEKEKTVSQFEKISNQFDVAGKLLGEITAVKNEVDSVSADVVRKISLLEEFLIKSASLPDAVIKTNANLEEAVKASENINALLKQAAGRKERIDELFKEIYGVDVENDEGKKVHIEGLRDKLDESYKNVVSQLELLSENVSSTIHTVRIEHEKSLATQRDNFSELVSNSIATAEAIENQLKSLLPGSLAAGLSAAYEEKKIEEVEALHRFEKTFRNAIVGMAFVSMIPFLLDFYLVYFQGKELVQVIKDTPRLVMAILPLYFPILWLAYSTNKQYKLSKRLIEEYTHKSVLGKTFSGLSNQIDALPHEGSVREELRNRLLFSILQVSAENPGKLITDYSKSDHPLMDALENSAKLADSIQRLSKIPGFSAIATKLAEKSDAILKEQDKKVKDGLSAQDVMGNKEEAVG